MKPKQIVILGVLLLVLLTGIFLRGLLKHGEIATEEYSGLQFAFAPERIVNIQIGKAESPRVELIRDQGVWKIPSLWNAKADPRRVTRFLNQIRDARGELRASDTSLFKDFGIQDNEAIYVRLFDSSHVPVIDLKIGTQTLGHRGLFIRDGKSEKVYLTDSYLYDELGIRSSPEMEKLQADIWTKLDLFDLDTEKINRITISTFEGNRPRLVTGLQKVNQDKQPSGDKWIFANKVSAEPDLKKIQAYLNSLPDIRASKVLDPQDPQYGFDHPIWQIELHLENQPSITMTVGRQDKKTKICFVKVSGEPAVFQLSDIFYQNLNVDNRHFETEKQTKIA